MPNLRRALVLPASLILLLLAPLAALAAEAAFLKGPWLIYDNDPAGMTVMWQTTDTVVSLITWDSSDGRHRGKVTENSPDDHLFSAKITGLKPDELVSYTVTVNSQQKGGTFKSASPATDKYLVLYALGDSRPDVDGGVTVPSVLSDVLKLLNADMARDRANRATLIMDPGDFVNTGMVEATWNTEFFNPQFPEIGKTLASMPLMVCQGNHEGYGGGGPAGALLRKYWPNLKNSYKGTPVSTYSFDYGPVHVAVLDQYTVPLEDPDYGRWLFDWLDRDLAAAEKPFKIVMFHLPAYAAGRQDHDKDHMDNPIMQGNMGILEKHGVQLVLQAHNHYYARAVNNGIQFLTLGGAGAPLADWAPEYMKAGSKVKVTAKNRHYARLEINGNEMYVTVVNADKTGPTVLDQFPVQAGMSVRLGADALAAGEPVPGKAAASGGESGPERVVAAN